MPRRVVATSIERMGNTPVKGPLPPWLVRAATGAVVRLSVPRRADGPAEITYGNEKAAGADHIFVYGAPGSWLPSLSRSEEHTSELQSLMRLSYAVLCLKNKKQKINNKNKTIKELNQLHKSQERKIIRSKAQSKRS